MSRPRVLVVAVPYVFASAIAVGIERARPDHYDVDAPHVTDGDAIPNDLHYDAVVTSLPVPTIEADVVIELPGTFHEVALVTVGGVTAPVMISPDYPIDEIVALLDRYTSAEREGGAHDRAAARHRLHLD